MKKKKERRKKRIMIINIRRRTHTRTSKNNFHSPSRSSWRHRTIKILFPYLFIWLIKNRSERERDMEFALEESSWLSLDLRKKKNVSLLTCFCIFVQSDLYFSAYSSWYDDGLTRQNILLQIFLLRVYLPHRTFNDVVALSSGVSWECRENNNNNNLFDEHDHH